MDENLVTEVTETLENNAEVVETVKEVVETGVEAVKNISKDDVIEIATKIAKTESLKMVTGIGIAGAAIYGIKKGVEFVKTRTTDGKLKKAEKLEAKAAKLRTAAEKQAPKKEKETEETETKTDEKKK